MISDANATCGNSSETLVFIISQMDSSADKIIGIMLDVLAELLKLDKAATAQYAHFRPGTAAT